MSKKRFEDLDLIDNYLVMAMASDPVAGPAYGRLLAEGLLHQKVRYVRIQPEKFVLGNDTVRRGIRMDVEMQAFDHEPAESEIPDRIYDFEPHRKNRDNLIKRNRFIQAKIDSNNLKSGENDFDKLPDLCVINILDYDPFDRGQLQYHFHNTCEEDASIPYPDGLDFYYFITQTEGAPASGTSNNIQGNDNADISDNAELRALLRYIQKSTPENATTPLTQELHKYVTKIKESSYGRNQYMTLGDYIDEEVEEACKAVQAEIKAKALAEGRAEGRAAGRAEGRAELCINLQNNILMVLSRLGTVSPITKDKINTCNDTAVLKEWFQTAVNADSIHSFEQNIQD